MERRGLEPVKRVAYFEYDFARDGGAVGDITLRGDALPNNAIVTEGMVYVVTAVTSGQAATVALKLVNAADVLAATGKATLAINALVDVVPVGTAATAIRTTSAGLKPVATVAVGALTAGKFIVALEYL